MTKPKSTNTALLFAGATILGLCAVAIGGVLLGVPVSQLPGEEIRGRRRERLVDRAPEACDLRPEDYDDGSQRRLPPLLQDGPSEKHQRVGGEASERHSASAERAGESLNGRGYVQAPIPGLGNARPSGRGSYPRRVRHSLRSCRGLPVQRCYRAIRPLLRRTRSTIGLE